MSSLASLIGTLSRLSLAPRLAKQKKISPEQLTAGKAIVETFAETNCRYVVLTALMQSGKTTVYYFAGAEMLRLKKVKKIVIFSGNSEKELRDQVTNSAAEKFYGFYSRYLRETVEMLEDDALDLVEDIKPKIKIVWGAHQLSNYRDDSKDTLYIWDESHFAQNNNMKPAMFLRNAGVAANGDPTALEQRNNYFLSVSATPFSEVSDVAHLNQFKRIIRLQSGVGYHSVETMLNAGKIIGFDDWKTCLRQAFESVDAGEKKFALIRLRDFKGNSNAVEAERMALSCGWDVKYYDATTISNASNTNKVVSLQNVLSNAPNKNTAIFLKGMCRMGKEVEKTHLNFCMETSTESKTDVVLQGLLGRMCGYHEFIGVRVFLNNKIVEGGELQRFIAWTHEEAVLPKKANNLLNNHKAKPSASMHPIIPIKISKASMVIDGSVDVDPQYDNQEHIKESVKAAFHRGDFVNHNCQAQMNEILCQIEDPVIEVQVRIVGKTSSGIIMPRTRAPVPSKIHEFFTAKTPCKLGSTNGIRANGGMIVIWWFSSDFTEYEIRKGDVFIDTRTKVAPSSSADVGIRARIPMTTGKEVFCRALETGEVVENNGTYPISLRPESSIDIDIMNGSLSEVIALSLQPSAFVVKARSITSNQTTGARWQGIVVTNEVFAALKKNGAIYRDMETIYGVKLKVQKKSGPQPVNLTEIGLVRLAGISW